MRIKITDVAKLAGASPSSVSRVIHNNGYVADEKRKKIEKALKDLNYHADFIARSLKTNKTGIMGHLIRDSYSNPFYANVAYGVDMRCSELNYHVITVTSYGDSKRQNDEIDTLISRRVDGIIITDDVNQKIITRLSQLKIPFALVERTVEIKGADMIYADNFGGSVNAVKLLHSLNHRKIAFVGAKSGGAIDTDRQAGFLEGMRLCNINPDDSSLKIGLHHDIETGYRLTKELMHAKVRPTAILVASDLLVAGAMQAFYDKGIKIPEDISVIGYDDTLSRFMAPPLTAVVQPMKEMGYEAVNLVYEKIRRESGSVRTILLETRIEIRSSTKRN